MSCKISFSAAAILLLLSIPLYSQSLGELAKKEKARRDQIKTGVKVITNAEAARFRNTAVTTEAPLPAAAASKESAETEPQVAVKKPANDEPTDIQGRPESFWRQTMSDARKRIGELENDANVLTLKLNDLQNQFYREASGFKQQDIQRDIQKTLYEQDQNKENLAKAKEQLTNLQNEARKSGALPGWLNP